MLYTRKQCLAIQMLTDAGSAVRLLQESAALTTNMRCMRFAQDTAAAHRLLRTQKHTPVSKPNVLVSPITQTGQPRCIGTANKTHLSDKPQAASPSTANTLAVGPAYTYVTLIHSPGEGRNLLSTQSHCIKQAWPTATKHGPVTLAQTGPQPPPLVAAPAQPARQPRVTPLSQLRPQQSPLPSLTQAVYRALHALHLVLIQFCM